MSGFGMSVLFSVAALIGTAVHYRWYGWAAFLTCGFATIALAEFMDRRR
jgi:uncharacterized protein involved in exopolysaccharide biosynthesis